MFKKYKQLIIGFTLGAIVFTAMPISAAVQKYVCSAVSYKIIVNGTEYNDLAQPALNYNGNTYVPLKNLGKLLGQEPKWNAEKKQVELGIASQDVDSSIWVNMSTASKKYGLLISAGDTIQFRKGDIKSEALYTVSRANGSILGEQTLTDINNGKTFTCLMTNGGRAYFKISELRDAGLID